MEWLDEIEKYEKKNLAIADLQDTYGTKKEEDGGLSEIE